ncbi:MAG: YdeI/OmpD-associated family protein [Anaerolineaceae bacterium]
MKQTFTTSVLQEEGMNATGIRVPAEIIPLFGMGKKPKVKITLNGYSYRTTVAAYGDVFMLPLSKEHRTAAGVKAGDVVEVTLEPDLEPRSVEVPADLAEAMKGEPGARAAFDALSYSVRKEFVRQVEDAKTEETRVRRIGVVLTKLKAG